MPNDQALLKRFMDEASIRNTIARFADSATRFDTDMFRTVWADDAEFIIGHAPHGQSATGVDDIVAMLRRLRAERDFFVQFALPGGIEIDGDESTTRTFGNTAARGHGKAYCLNHSIASDRLQRAGDGWVFASRSFQYLWLDTSSFTGDAFPLLPTVAAP
jgi:hypothetical protein